MQPELLPSRAQRWAVSLVPITICGLISGLVIGLAGVGLIFPLFWAALVVAGFGQPPELGFEQALDQVFGLASKVSDRLVIGLIGGLVVGLRTGLGPIRPTESLRWSWRKARDYSVLGLVIGLASCLTLELISGLTADQIVTRTIPNEGIRRSRRNALICLLIIGLGAGLSAGLVAGVMFGMMSIGYELAIGLDTGLPFGLVVGLVVGLHHGGVAYLKHYVLRFLLWRNDYAPWNYVRFLDYAAERVFLRKVGGGYIFTHRLLMEYFAALRLTDQAQQAQTA